MSSLPRLNHHHNHIFAQEFRAQEEKHARLTAATATTNGSAKASLLIQPLLYGRLFASALAN